ncbi:hypothetical protein [Streptomyces sp. G45]|uniref:hypothetical protein n=1 Tax=Streptomyces sp. G45 TaxID=3406627 RepID=UPI003C19317F
MRRSRGGREGVRGTTRDYEDFGVRVGRGWPVLFAVLMVGATACGEGIGDLHAADPPLTCGDRVMPDDDRHTCWNGEYGSGPYDDLARQRQEAIDDAPDLVVGDGTAMAVSVAGALFLWWGWRRGASAGGGTSTGADAVPTRPGP